MRSQKRQGLIMVAVMQFAFVVEIIVEPYPPPNPDGSLLLFQLISLELRGSVWAVCAILAALSAVTHKTQWVGWVLLMVMPATRFVAYAWSFIMWLIPSWPTGQLNALPYALFWAAWASLVVIMARWPDLAPHMRGMEKGQNRADVREQERRDADTANDGNVS